MNSLNNMETDGDSRDSKRQVSIRWISALIYERVIIMENASQAVREKSWSNLEKDRMKDFIGGLDEAIDDMERGRVQTIEEAWAEVNMI